MPISDIVVVEYSLNLHFIYSHRPLAFTNVIEKNSSSLAIAVFRKRVPLLGYVTNHSVYYWRP